MTGKLLVLSAVCLSLGACTSKPARDDRESALVASEIGCPDAETRLFDRLIEGGWGDSAMDRKALHQSLRRQAELRLKDSDLLAAYEKILQFLLEEAPQRTKEKDLRLLYGDFEAGHVGRSTDDILAKEYAVLRVQTWPKFSDVGGLCQAGPRPERASAPAENPAWGMRWTFATAYQSCKVLHQPPLTVQDPDVGGIKSWCCHPDGVGFKREITDPVLVSKTNPYIQPPVDLKSCVDVSRNPLIYNYGGKPFLAEQGLDLHRVAGDGTNVLGIDCSAYVSTALLTAGLKLSKSAPLRPVQAQLYSSGDFLHPEEDGLSCLTRISVGKDQSLRDGDLVGVQGHVFMVGEVGADPFGLQKIHKLEDCQKLSTENLHFNIYQSSNSKNGLGLNRFKAADYVAGSSHDTFRKGLLAYAQQACMARLAKTAVTPQLAELAITRHVDSSECQGPRVPLIHESCVAACMKVGEGPKTSVQRSANP